MAGKKVGSVALGLGLGALVATVMMALGIVDGVARWLRPVFGEGGEMVGIYLIASALTLVVNLPAQRRLLQPLPREEIAALSWKGALAVLVPCALVGLASWASLPQARGFLAGLGAMVGMMIGFYGMACAVVYWCCLRLLLWWDVEAER